MTAISNQLIFEYDLKQSEINPDNQYLNVYRHIAHSLGMKPEYNNPLSHIVCYEISEPFTI